MPWKRNAKAARRRFRRAFSVRQKIQMIKIQTKKRTVRETTAPFETIEDGKVTVTDIRVMYYSPTTADLKARRSAIAAKLKDDPDAPVWYSAMLAEKIHSLPDLIDETGKEFEINEGFLDTLEIKNLDAIRNAIDEAVSPKAPPEK